MTYQEFIVEANRKSTTKKAYDGLGREIYEQPLLIQFLGSDLSYKGLLWTITDFMIIVGGFFLIGFFIMKKESKEDKKH